LSPGLRLNTYDDISPGGTSFLSGGGVAMRMLNLRMPLSRVVGHGVGAHDLFLVDRFQVEQAEVVPVAAVLVRDVEVLELDVEGRGFHLHEAAGAEVDFLALGQLEHQFLDEGGDVVVGDDLALPLLDLEELRRHDDLHVALDRTWQARRKPSRTSLAGEVVDLGRQDVATAVEHLAPALAAGAAAAAGRGQEDALRDSVPSSLSPALATRVLSGSSLTSMLTSPLTTSLERAKRITITSSRTTPVKVVTPKMISRIMLTPES
jgi:hypothetical protein